MSGHEEWRDIDGWPYQVSSLGNVRTARPVAQHASSDGYCRVHMYSGSATTRPQVHRLVASAFIGPPPSPNHVVAHKNSDPSDNRWENLYWATTSENTADRKRRGGYPDGEKALNASLTNEAARKIRFDFHKKGRSINAISKDYGVSRPTIKGIVTGIRYRSAGGLGT